MAYELEIALVTTIGASLGTLGWVTRTVIRVLTEHLSAMTTLQAGIATTLNGLSQKLDRWDDRWVDIKKAVDATNQGGPR